jgi:CarD family transcriptional regulator
MHFNVGQNIVHPAHGAGTIIDISNQELVSGFAEYYVIEFSEQRMTIHLPVERIDEIGLRRVMSEDKYERVLETLGNSPETLPSDYKQRRQQVEEMVNSGAPVEVARAIRELTWRRSNKPLNNSDSRLLTEARSKLVQEVVMATGYEMTQVQAEIDSALARSALEENAQNGSEVVH